MTLIDYPGKVACIVFTAGCTFRCRFCYNPEAVLPEVMCHTAAIPEAEVFAFLDKRKGLLDGVSICGGEPTLQSDLVAFCRQIKDRGFCVKLDTNGTNATVLATLLDQHLVDYVAIDAKRPYTEAFIAEGRSLLGTEISKSIITNYKKCLALLRAGSIPYEYRTTVIKWWHTPAVIDAIAKQLQWIPHYFLQNYRAGRTLDPSFRGAAFTHTELQNFKEIAQKYIENVAVRE